MRTTNARAILAGSASQSAALPNTELPRLMPELLAPTLEKRVQKILQMVESGMASSVRELALELNLSPAHVQRLFKEKTGLRMGEWLCEQRLQKAAQLLAGSYLSVKEIAHAVGYEHSSSFIRAFERRFLQPPSRYRAQGDRTKC